jgi:hypothetical protein
MGAIGGRRRAAQARVATMQTGQLGTVGIGSLVLVMFVIMGAVRYVIKVVREAAMNVDFALNSSPLQRHHPTVFFYQLSRCHPFDKGRERYTRGQSTRRSHRGRSGHYDAGWRQDGQGARIMQVCHPVTSCTKLATLYIRVYPLYPTSVLSDYASPGRNTRDESCHSGGSA